jgi:hypothetical protein
MSALKTVEPDAGRAAGAAATALEDGGEAENGKTAGTLGAAAATTGAGAAGGGVARGDVAGGIAPGRFVETDAEAVAGDDEIAAEAPGDGTEGPVSTSLAGSSGFSAGSGFGGLVTISIIFFFGGASTTPFVAAAAAAVPLATSLLGAEAAGVEAGEAWRADGEATAAAMFAFVGGALVGGGLSARTEGGLSGSSMCAPPTVTWP